MPSRDRLSSLKSALLQPNLSCQPGLVLTSSICLFYFIFFLGFVFCCFSSWTNLPRELITVGMRGKGKTVAALSLRCKGRADVVTCVICLPFARIYLLHLTFYVCTSRQRVLSRQPHRARERPCHHIPPLFLLRAENSSVKYGDKFPASLGSRGGRTPISPRCKVRTSHLVQPRSRAEPIFPSLLFFGSAGTHAPSHDGAGTAIVRCDTNRRN